jgi:hypothetical protein
VASLANSYCWYAIALPPTALPPTAWPKSAAQRLVAPAPRTAARPSGLRRASGLYLAVRSMYFGRASDPLYRWGQHALNGKTSKAACSADEDPPNPRGHERFAEVYTEGMCTDG